MQNYTGKIKMTETKIETEKEYYIVIDLINCLYKNEIVKSTFLADMLKLLYGVAQKWYMKRYPELFRYYESDEGYYKQ